MKQIELLIEASKGVGNKKDEFTKTRKKYNYDIEVSHLEILSQEISKRVGLEKGRYINIDLTKDFFYDFKFIDLVSKIFAKSLKEMILKEVKDFKKIFVVGLGNRYFMADSLGERVFNKIFTGETVSGKEVKAFSPGVYGQTGMDTQKMISSIIDEIKPDVIIVIDALVTTSLKRLVQSIQITNTSIIAGGGINNNRNAFSKKNLNVPLIVVGVPLMIYASSIALETCKDIDEKLVKRICKNKILTLNDIDSKVKCMSTIIANGINMISTELKLSEIKNILN